jgi:diadenosine tetraphosphate (Ap4A) HIT family hydrolase
VFHVHVHLVPRYDRSELNLPWIPTPAPVEQLDAIHADLVR